MIISQHTGPQERAHFPIALQFLQAPLFTKQAADLYSCSKENNKSQEFVLIQFKKNNFSYSKSLNCLHYYTLSILIK